MLFPGFNCVIFCLFKVLIIIERSISYIIMRVSHHELSLCWLVGCTALGILLHILSTSSTVCLIGKVFLSYFRLGLVQNPSSKTHRLNAKPMVS